MNKASMKVRSCYREYNVRTLKKYCSLLLFLGLCIPIVYTFSQYDYRDKKLKALKYSYELTADGPNNWSKKYPECVADRQSPINIHTQSAIPENMPRITRNVMYSKTPKEIILSKTPYTIIVKPIYASQNATLTGGPLKSIYVLEHVEFHWGSSNNVGSEHTLNGKRYSMEMHAIHRNIKYETMEEAMANGDGLAIVAYLFHVFDRRSLILDILQKQLNNLSTQTKEEVNLKEKFPMSFFLPAPSRNYVTYFGSITRPPCSQVVTWIVHLIPISIRQDQIETFRKLYQNTTSLINNFRPIQPVNKRPINIPS